MSIPETDDQRVQTQAEIEARRAKKQAEIEARLKEWPERRKYYKSEWDIYVKQQEEKAKEANQKPNYNRMKGEFGEAMTYRNMTAKGAQFIGGHVCHPEEL